MFKIVYVTVGADKIEYINMQRIAVASAKKHMPQVPVVIVTDGETLPKLRGYKELNSAKLSDAQIAQIIERPEQLFNRFPMYADSSVEYRLTTPHTTTS